MIIRVAEAHLQGVVVNIADRQIGADLANADGLVLKPCHGSGGVLGQGLIDAKTDLLAGNHLAGNEVLFNNLVGNGLAHSATLLRR